MLAIFCSNCGLDINEKISAIKSISCCTVWITLDRIAKQLDVFLALAANRGDNTFIVSDNRVIDVWKVDGSTITPGSRITFDRCCCKKSEMFVSKGIVT